MKVNDIVWRLAELASLPFQERYVIGATAEEYLLATELLENVDSLQYLVSRPENAYLLNADQLAALDELFKCIDEHSGEALSGASDDATAELIRSGTVWKMLRIKASSALSTFGLSATMTVEEIDKLSE